MTIEASIRIQKGSFSLHADFIVPGEGVTAVFGRSGCGKSSLLRVLAGLDIPDPVSRISINEQIWFNADTCVPVHKRRVGYVSQEPCLFSHLTIGGNLKYAFVRRATCHKAPGFHDVVNLLGLERFLDRFPHTLSGGERQRAAIGRALLSAPALLLMDEPLAALDQSSKEEILPFLDSLCGSAKMPVLYVSHSPDEVARLANHLIIMDEGRVVAHGGLTEVLGRADCPIAQTDEAFSILECEIVELNGPAHLTVLKTHNGDRIFVPRLATSRHQTRVRINARDVSLCTQKPVGSTILNILQVTVAHISLADAKGQQLVQLQMPEDSGILFARISQFSCQQLGIQKGMYLYCQIKAIALLS